MDWFHPALGLVAASSAFTLDGVQYPAGWLRSQQPDGFLPVRVTPRPDDRLFFVSEQIVTVIDGEAVVSWNAEARDPADIKAAQDREANAGLVIRLEALDKRKARPLGAIVAAQLAGQTPHPLDVASLTALEAEAAELRSQIRG
ncbi:hypothetical protein [Paramagnetospirillum magneticum]|nr:hypothetical protein [Paramagnetospirillum magneticum]